jgi:hypothetical protein
MPKGTRHYSASEVAVIVGGELMECFADGAFITIAVQPHFVTHKGADGCATRTKVMDRTAEITLRLGQESPSNQILSALAALDDNAPGLVGAFPLVIKNLTGTTEFFAPSAWISKRADIEFSGDDQTNREWIISAQDYAYQG